MQLLELHADPAVATRGNVFVTFRVEMGRTSSRRTFPPRVPETPQPTMVVIRIESMGPITNVDTWSICFLSTDCYKICYFLKHNPNKNARKLNELCALQGDAENLRLAGSMKRDGYQ